MGVVGKVDMHIVDNLIAQERGKNIFFPLIELSQWNDLMLYEISSRKKVIFASLLSRRQ